MGRPRTVYHTGSWDKARRVAIARWRAAGRPPCGICGEPVLPAERVSVDHVVRPKDAPQLFLAQENLRVTHLHCNVQRGKLQRAEDRARELLREPFRSRDW